MVAHYPIKAGGFRPATPQELPVLFSVRQSPLHANLHKKVANQGINADGRKPGAGYSQRYR